MIGDDRCFQSQGFGGDLPIDCLMRFGRTADALGTAIVVVDVLGCGVPHQKERRRALYLDDGFEPLPFNPLRERPEAIFQMADRFTE